MSASPGCCARCGGWIPETESESYLASDGECPGSVGAEGICGAFRADLDSMDPSEEGRREELLAELAELVGDDGTGDLGVVVDCGLSDDSDVTARELADVVEDARAEARAARVAE